jgi:WD40 repeat protein
MDPAGPAKSPVAAAKLPRVVALEAAVQSGLKWSAPTRGLKQKYALAWSPSGDRIASRGGEGVQIWSASDGKPLTTFPADSQLEFYDFAFAPGGQLLAGAATDGVHLFDLESDEELDVLKTDEKTTNSIHRLAFSADGQWLAAGQLHGTTVWKTAGWERAITLSSDTGWVGGVAFSHDGKLFAAGGQDKQVRVWRVPDWKLVFERLGPSPVYTVAFSPDSATLAAAFSSGSGGQFLFLAPALGERITAVDAHSKLAHTVAYRADGRQIATAGDDGTLALWDAAARRPLIRIQADRASVFCAGFSPDGTSLASVGSEHILRVWDANSLEKLAADSPSPTNTLPQ